jgi:hypothetical protein
LIVAAISYYGFKERAVMRTRDYFELFRYLAEQRCLGQEDILFVDSIVGWCADHGIPEADEQRPMKLIQRKAGGCRMLIKEDVEEPVIEERINAMRIRDQLKNVAFDRADLLNSVQKKLAFLFLGEYAYSLPEVGDDDILADTWAFEEMERLGYFRK